MSVETAPASYNPMQDYNQLQQGQSPDLGQQLDPNAPRAIDPGQEWGPVTESTFSQPTAPEAVATQPTPVTEYTVRRSAMRSANLPILRPTRVMKRSGLRVSVSAAR